MKIFLSLVIWLFSFTELSALNVLKSATIEKSMLHLVFTKEIDDRNVKKLVLKSSQSVRYVLDFKNTMVRKRSLAKMLSHKSVRSFRISQFNSNTVRVVIESAVSYKIEHKKISNNIYEVTLPLGKYSIGKSNVSDLFGNIDVPSKRKQKLKKKRVKHGELRKVHVKRPKKRYTIVVDPGHGGRDSGALGGSRKFMEKTVVLQIARRVRKHLKRLGFRVYMTRSNNRFVKLGVRTRYANKKHADAFVSIHANAVEGNRRYSTEGIETYFLQVSRSERSKRVASRENSVVLQAKDKISKNVLLNLMTGPKIIMSNKMAIDVQKGMLKNLKKRFHTIKDNGVRPAPFWVLVGAQMPSVLVETGYITHPQERKRLFNTKYQELIAKGIAEGISNYFANHEREME